MSTFYFFYSFIHYLTNKQNNNNDIDNEIRISWEISKIIMIVLFHWISCFFFGFFGFVVFRIWKKIENFVLLFPKTRKWGVNFHKSEIILVVHKILFSFSNFFSRQQSSFTSLTKTFCKFFFSGQSWSVKFEKSRDKKIINDVMNFFATTCPVSPPSSSSLPPLFASFNQPRRKNHTSAIQKMKGKKIDEFNLTCSSSRKTFLKKDHQQTLWKIKMFYFW